MDPHTLSQSNRKFQQLGVTEEQGEDMVTETLSLCCGITHKHSIQARAIVRVRPITRE